MAKFLDLKITIQDYLFLRQKQAWDSAFELKLNLVNAIIRHQYFVTAFGESR